MHIFNWLAPFFAYHYFTEDEGHQIRVALISGVLAVGVYLVAEVLKFGVAIVGKRILAGQIKAGRYPLWGVTYFRWWLGGMLGELAPAAMVSGTPLLVWYLRALGAKIGKNVLIDSVEIQVPELVTMEDGCSIGTQVNIENAHVERGELVIGTVLLRENVVIDSYTVVEGDTVIGTGAWLGGLSAVAAGQTIPAYETWEGRRPGASIARWNRYPLVPT